MPFQKESFDAAYMFHVGMNIADKNALFQDVARVLKTGGEIFDLRLDAERTTSRFRIRCRGRRAGRRVLSFTLKAIGRRSRPSGFEVVHERGRREFGDRFF